MGGLAGGDCSRLFPLNHLNPIADTNPSRTPNFGQNTLAVLQHPLAQALTNGIHFLAGISRGIQKEHRFTNADFLPDERDQVDSSRFNVRTHHARQDFSQSQSARMLGDLFPLNQGDLPACGFARITAEFAKIPRVAFNPLGFDQFHFIYRTQSGAGRVGMQMQGRHLAFIAQ
jgi:hypothetical protein